jgi:hypothetical protein
VVSAPLINGRGTWRVLCWHAEHYLCGASREQFVKARSA